MLNLICYIYITFVVSLNRIRKKPYTQRPDFPPDTPHPHIANTLWELYKQRNDSIVVDLFQGEFKSQVTCLVCHREAVTFDRK